MACKLIFILQKWLSLSVPLDRVSTAVATYFVALPQWNSRKLHINKTKATISTRHCCSNINWNGTIAFILLFVMSPKRSQTGTIFIYIHILLAYCIIMSLVDAIACGNGMKKIIFDEAQRILCLLVTKTTSNHWMLLSLSKLRMQKYYFFVCHFCGNKTTLHEQL